MFLFGGGVIDCQECTSLNLYQNSDIFFLRQHDFFLPTKEGEPSLGEAKEMNKQFYGA